MNGLRFNDGKIRYDLIEPYQIQELAKVYTAGAEKYAENNWLSGMKTSKMLASLKRHIAAFEMGEDKDSETGCHHLAHAAWNALAIVSYSRYFPEADDRLFYSLPKKKIGLDIDEVIVDWVGPWTEKFGYSAEPENWYFSYENKKHFQELIDSGEFEEFYASLPAKIRPEDMPFEPHCYITSRSVDVEITKFWLQTYGFPCKPVYTVPFGASKLQAAKDSGIDIFVDDHYDNFLELNSNGIFTYLMDAPHNRKHNVGNRRIKSLKEIAHLV